MSYDYWIRGLADPKALRARDFKITSEPQLGFYRDKGGKAVAIWEEDGEIVIMSGNTELSRNEYERVWLSCAMRPVTEDWYRHWMGIGRWPDVDEAIAAMGDNVRTGMDEVQQIDELETQVKTYRQLESDEQAAQAQSLRARLLELKAIVDKKREELKAPHLKEARAIDEVWMAPVKKAIGCANSLKALIEGWENLKRRRLREEQAALEKDFGERKPAPKPTPVPVVEPLTQVRGGTGRAASVREKYVVTGISNLDMALQAYRYSDEVAEAMLKLAQAAVDRGANELPGFIIELKAVLR